MIKLKPLLISIAIPLVLGFATSFFLNSKEVYLNYIRPSFAPPPIVFPIVWIILYILMGISSYLIYTTKSKYTKPALYVYGFQLIINILWPVFFFKFKLLLFSFWWICLLLAVTLVMVRIFFVVNNKSGYLQLPYVFWLVFAGILNYSIYLLN